MASEIKSDKLSPSTGTSLQIGDASDTITIPTGATFTITDGLGVAGGGTGLTSFTAGDVLYATGTTTLAKLAKGTAEQVLAMNSGATAPDWGSVDLTVLPTITVAKGGTNLSSFTAGDVLYATGSTTLAKLAKGSADDVLTMNSGATAPEWAAAAGGGKIGQVLCATKTDTQSFTAASWTDITDLTIAITPSATSSKIWWSYNFWGNSNVDYGDSKIVYGDNSDLTTQAIGDAAGSRRRGTGQFGYDSGSDRTQNQTGQGLDAPNTTSATTYKLQYYQPSGTYYLNRSVTDSDATSNPRGFGSLTVMEVLA